MKKVKLLLLFIASSFLLFPLASCGDDTTTVDGDFEEFTVKFETGEYATIIENRKVTDSKKLTKPADPKKAAFKFVGWYTDNEYTKEFDFSSSITQNLTLYAKWEEDEDIKCYEYVFNTNHTAIIINKLKGEYKNINDIKIPSCVNAIKEKAFLNCDNIINVSIEEGIESIYKDAFLNCVNLEKINLPESLDLLEESVFENCNSLKNITIPNKINKINKKLFYNCKSLKSIKLSNSIKSIGENAFYGCENLEELELPNGFEAINNMAFYNCKKLTNIKLPNNLIELGFGAFYGCEKLESIDLLSVSEIKGNTFAYCTNLKNIKLPNNLNVIEDSAFLNCNSLTKIFYYGDLNDFNNININDDLNNSTIYYFSEEAKTGNYWHYVNNIPTIWE